MTVFTKKCRECGVEIKGARNLRLCVKCGTHQPKIGGRKSRFEIDKSSFEDREFRSYFLGFCSSDGSARQTPKGRLSVIRYYSTDKEVLEKIDRRMKNSHPISINREYDDHRKTCWENMLFADNARLVQSFGLVSDKTQLSLNQMDVDLFPFLRGLCDGDGSIDEKERVEFLGQFLLLNSVRAHLAELHFEVHEPKRKHHTNRDENCWVVAVGSYPRACWLLGKMYEGATIYMQRKFESYQRLVNSRMV